MIKYPYITTNCNIGTIDAYFTVEIKLIMYSTRNRREDMKLTSLAKSVLAASALTVASFGANASVIAEASIDVIGLKIVTDNPFALTDTSISFTGTSVQTILNGNIDGSAYLEIVDDPFAPLSIDLDSLQTNGTSLSLANADIAGNFLTPVGATGNTTANTEAYGTNTADSGAQIYNDLKATFNFSTQADTSANISFDWVIDTYVHVFDQGGEGQADWKLNITLSEVGCTGFGCSNLFDFNLGNTLSSSSSGIVNTVGGIWDADTFGSVSENVVLKEGSRYQLIIDQAVNASAISVPEHTSVAILGLGLLGFAGAARRRKS